VFGDVASGLLSQALRSRRKVVLLFMIALLGSNVLYFVLGRGAPPGLFLALIAVLGVTAGYWAIFITVGAEQFGTNIRATVATTVPNFVRGLVAVVTLSFAALRPQLGLPGAAAVVGLTTFALALVSALRLRETFGTDLDYVEGD
jgi:MFS transporter, putative metabolite:H+ symporter